VKIPKESTYAENEVRGRSGVDGCVLFTIVRQQTNSDGQGPEGDSFRIPWNGEEKVWKTAVETIFTSEKGKWFCKNHMDKLNREEINSPH